MILFAQPLSKMELGLAGGGQYLADYRGSDEYHETGLPFPIFHYRGERIRVDRRGIRGDLLSDRSWQLNVSGEVSLNGGSDDNERREGMSELDSAFEVGPSLDIALDGDVEVDGWMIRLPLRSVFTVGSDGIDYIGYVFNPMLVHSIDKGAYSWRVSNSVGGLWGSERFHDYYYQVDPQFVRSDRAEYDAESGFSGYYFRSTISKRSGDWRYGMSLRYDNLSGAVFNDSPLVETENYFSVSFLIAKYFWQSND
jgi:outer membrane scaffolding protein for murein synthesis (MipA/OmpV family)